MRAQRARVCVCVDVGLWVPGEQNQNKSKHRKQVHLIICIYIKRYVLVVLLGGSHLTRAVGEYT